MNSELAVSNIENSKNLNIDLYTYVIDWEVFRDIQLSFLKANPDGEIPTDHALTALLYEIANQKGINISYTVQISEPRVMSTTSSIWTS